MTRPASDENDLRYRPPLGVGLEADHRGLVEHLPEAVIVRGDGRFLYANPAAVELLGISYPEELASRWVLDFVHPDYREMVKTGMARVQEERKRAGLIEEKLVRLDGGVVEVEATGKPISYEGKPAVLAVESGT